MHNLDTGRYRRHTNAAGDQTHKGVHLPGWKNTRTKTMPHAGTDYEVKHHGSEIAFKNQTLLVGQSVALGQNDDQWVPAGSPVAWSRQQQWGRKNTPHSSRTGLQVTRQLVCGQIVISALWQPQQDNEGDATPLI